MFDDSDNELEKSYRPPTKPVVVKVEVKKKSNFDDSDDEVEAAYNPPPTRAT